MKSILSPSFRHGVHPHGHKQDTEHRPIERMPFVDVYVLPLSQHTGAPCRPVVLPGEKVRRGQLLAEPGGFVSMSLHSPVSGRVQAIAPRPHPNGRLVESIVLEADPYASQRLDDGPSLDPASLSDAEFVEHVQRAGLVGMGGAAFPTHVKYKLPDGKRIHRLVVNGAECEPYLTTDHRTMVERPADVVRGAEIVGRRLGVSETVIGVEQNKPDAIEALERVVGGRPGMRVVPLHVKYPQGAEKMLIKAIYGEEIPSGKLPLDVGAIVNNVATMVGIADYFDRGLPMVERVLTVAGPAVGRPSNLLVPLGTPVRAVLDHCDALGRDTREVVMGGPMMGTPIASLDVPVLKGTSGLLAFTESDLRQAKEYTCIKCGRCVDACPQFLNPSRLARLSRSERYAEAERSFIYDCVECGSCSFACPSGIPIVHLIRVAKSALRSKKAS